MIKSKLEKPVYVVIKTESKPQIISRSKTINCTTDSAEQLPPHPAHEVTQSTKC